MTTLTEDDFTSVEWEDTVTAAVRDETAPIVGESLRPKFDSVAAFKLHQWSLDSGQSEDHGSAIDWHRWSAIFRNVTDSDSSHKSEQPAAMLHTNPQGFVTAEWYSDGVGAEEVWASLVKEWEEYEDAEEDGL
jgi:hypothetical protein